MTVVIETKPGAFPAGYGKYAIKAMTDVILNLTSVMMQKLYPAYLSDDLRLLLQWFLSVAANTFKAPLSGAGYQPNGRITINS